MTDRMFEAGDKVIFKDECVRENTGLLGAVGVITSTDTGTSFPYEVYFAATDTYWACQGRDLELIEANGAPPPNIIKPERAFKVGDRVKNKFFPAYEGTIDYIADAAEAAKPYDVILEGFTVGHCGHQRSSTAKNHWWFAEEDLELVKSNEAPQPSFNYLGENAPASEEVKVVSSNQHYETSVQPIEFMQANMAPEEFVGFLKGNIIKYAGRCGRKDEPLKEAKKIKQYAGWLVDALEGRTVDPRA